MSVKFLIQGTIAERVKRKEYEWKVIKFLGEFFFIIILGRNAVSILTSCDQLRAKIVPKCRNNNRLTCFYSYVDTLCSNAGVISYKTG